MNALIGRFSTLFFLLNLIFKAIQSNYVIKKKSDYIFFFVWLFRNQREPYFILYLRHFHYRWTFICVFYLMDRHVWKLYVKAIRILKSLILYRNSSSWIWNSPDPIFSVPFLVDAKFIGNSKAKFVLLDLFCDVSQKCHWKGLFLFMIWFLCVKY